MPTFYFSLFSSSHRYAPRFIRGAQAVKNMAFWKILSIYSLHFKVRSLAPRWRMKFEGSDWEKLQEYSTVFRGFSIDERSNIAFSWDDKLASWSVMSIYPLHFKVRSLAPRWTMKFGRSDWEKLQEHSTVFRGFSIDEPSKITFSWDDKLASWSAVGINWG